MIFADTHTHLYLEEFDKDREQVLRQCAETGVKYLFFPNIDKSSIQPMLDLCTTHEHCYPMMGLHPSEVRENYRDALKDILKQMDIADFVGIGEIGMDLYWDKTFLMQQREVLRQQLLWARELSLPVCLHVRKAYNELFGLLRDLNFATYSGVMHCFGGSVQEAHKAVEMGFHIGVGGVVTFKNATLAEVAAAVPLDRILLETDCPYLSPVPHRGQRNESSYIPLIAQKIADLRNIPLAQVAETTTASALQLFAL